MNNSFKRVFFMMVTVIMGSFLVLGSAFMLLSYRYIVSEKKNTMNEHAAYISGLTSRLVDASFSADAIFDASALAAAVVGDEEILVCDGEGWIRFAYTEEGVNLELRGRVSEDFVQTVNSQGSYQGLTDLGLYDGKQLVVAVPLFLNTGEGEQGIGVTILVSSVEGFQELWHAMAFLFLLIAVVVLCIAFITCWFSCRKSTRPLIEMTSIVRRFGLGEYELRVDEKHTRRKDEVGELATAFNNMADSIALAEEQRQEFVSNISHELKTPMTTIQGFVDGILDGTVPPEKERESLQVISNETRRLSRLVRRMLDASRLAAQTQAGQPRAQTQFDLNETVARVIVSLERKITAHGLDMDVQLPENPTIVWGDADSVTQVCYNLLDNAAKFARPGTAIGFYVTPKGNKVNVTVRNVGETIPSEELPLIFDRFHKSDRSRSLDKEGVGLGLYIVKTILNSLQETITVTSEDGVTSFVFTLTRAE